MPKLPSITSRAVTSFLRAHGFLLDHATGSHFVFYRPVDSRRAVVPRHPRDIPVGTLLALLREAGFSRDELIDFLQK